jgi:hypothetical protein
LAGEILADPRVAEILDLLNGPWGEGERTRLEGKLAQSLAIYTNSRFAAGEIANLLLTSGVGAAALHQATPGVLTLGPALAGWVAEKLAAVTLPHGTLSGLYHAIVPAGVLLGTAVFSAVSGVVTDPLQKALGLHQRRLVMLLDVLERGFLGEDEAELVLRDQYVVRLAELLDLAVAAWRFAKG